MAGSGMRFGKSFWHQVPVLGCWAMCQVLMMKCQSEVLYITGLCVLEIPCYLVPVSGCWATCQVLLMKCQSEVLYTTGLCVLEIPCYLVPVSGCWAMCQVLLMKCQSEVLYTTGLCVLEIPCYMKIKVLQRWGGGGVGWGFHKANCRYYSKVTA